MKKYLAVQIWILLDSWDSKLDSHFGSSLEEYANAWVNPVNRGGVHHANDEFDLFINGNGSQNNFKSGISD